MDDDLFIIGTASFLLMAAICLKRRKNKRRCWVNPYLKGRDFRGRYNDFADIKSFPPSFRENFHMTNQHFDDIFNKIEQHLQPARYVRQDIIPPRAKLAMVLEYLACGSLQRHIASNYRVSKQAFGKIVDQVCTSICMEMGNEMPKLNKEQWLQISNTFNCKWDFPNCVGAIDGKHIAIKCPPNAGNSTALY
ncbi:uncharacterized protein LOC129572115 isoform X2 [Sitodiplosis mosellana]|uniref:uncharacterized protein LOC129572115 isoform X2 n=1 Tax=Sitodiplosis mosellana TaxID=263140 RepID=UPI00244446AE|nr:uncharacterized protein LOC129572115 isoform X2 [Sitodiplosis mosellana]